jgi:hypothetical protein
MLCGIWKVVLILILSGLVVQAQAPQNISQTQTTSDVDVQLILADKKTTFRIGEPIRLIMVFTAKSEGYSVDTLEDRKEPTSDSVSITPESGFTRWLDDKNRGRVLGRDVFGLQSLSSGPVRVGLTLNDTLRFDRIGKYTVSITTRRVTGRTFQRSSPIKLTTNEVSFEIVPMTREEEQAEIKRITSLLDAKRDLQTDEVVTAQLSYLTGDDSTREKARRFLNLEDRSGNYHGHIWFGLFIARNRDLALQLLETGIRDLNQPVDRSLLDTVSRIRFLKENQATPYEKNNLSYMLTREGDPGFTAIQNRYLSELAMNLSKRTGKSLTQTAMTILTTADKASAEWANWTSEARRVLVQHFASLHPYTQESLLRTYGDDLRDPSLIGHLKRMLAYDGNASKNIHDAAIQRLIEWAPAEARPYVVNDICNPLVPIDPEIAGKLSDQELPEVDACLLEQFKQTKRSFIENKATLMVRFATANIYHDVLRIYRDNNPQFSLEVRAVFLAYLAKHNEPEALILIEEVLVGLGPDRDSNFLPKLTKLYYSPAIANILKKRLDGQDPGPVSNAAYLLGVHGVAGDELVLQSRLDRWRKEWADRVVEADTNQQGRIERELVYALIHGKAWKLTPERIKELKLNCVTKFCKQSNP